jgi:hypothetical protein
VPSIERLYQDNLRYSKDPDLIGDVKAVAKGAAGATDSSGANPAGIPWMDPLPPEGARPLLPPLPARVLARPNAPPPPPTG